MTDATITDITVYRLSKGADFSNWNDSRIDSRYNLLKQVEKKGVEVFGEPDNSIFKLAFPDGYDPLNHADDNIDVVYAEGLRRGVFTESQ